VIDLRFVVDSDVVEGESSVGGPIACLMAIVKKLVQRTWTHYTRLVLQLLC